MGRCVDLTGQKFGKLTVIKRVEDDSEAHINGYVNVSVEILLQQEVLALEVVLQNLVVA